jgi:hypothetical protein
MLYLWASLCLNYEGGGEGMLVNCLNTKCPNYRALIGGCMKRVLTINAEGECLSFLSVGAETAIINTDGGKLLETPHEDSVL